MLIYTKIFILGSSLLFYKRVSYGIRIRENHATLIINIARYAEVVALINQRNSQVHPISTLFAYRK